MLFFFFDIVRSMTASIENAPPKKSAKTDNSVSLVQIQIGPTFVCESVRKIPGNLTFPFCSPVIKLGIRQPRKKERQKERKKEMLDIKGDSICN